MEAISNWANDEKLAAEAMERVGAGKIGKFELRMI